MRTMLSTLLALLVLAAAGAAGPALASGGADLRMEPAHINRLSAESLQRGARNFTNYCLNCHSARFMRYNRLTDLGLSEAMIQDNLMFASDKIGETMTVAMTAKDAKAWFGAPPPDLSLQSRVRGTEWLYNYFLAFYRDDASPTGWNNLVFPNVGMPHVLWSIGGTNRLVTKEFAHHDEAAAAALAAKRLVNVAPAPGGKYLVQTLEPETPGELSPEQYRAFVADLVNYMDYVAEPAKNKRINLGLYVLLYLGVLFVFAYWLKREYWKDVH
jgi:ubiquinol-cytochrome c reductase cytochrome c1 subunit